MKFLMRLWAFALVSLVASGVVAATGWQLPSWCAAPNMCIPLQPTEWGYTNWGCSSGGVCPPGIGCQSWQQALEDARKQIERPTDCSLDVWSTDWIVGEGPHEYTGCGWGEYAEYLPLIEVSTGQEWFKVRPMFWRKVTPLGQCNTTQNGRGFIGASRTFFCPNWTTLRLAGSVVFRGVSYSTQVCWAPGAVGGEDNALGECQPSLGGHGGADFTGRPINLATGNKYFQERIYDDPRGLLSLSLHYNSGAHLVSSNFARLWNGVVSPNWRHSFEAKLHLAYDRASHSVAAFRPDGKIIYFVAPFQEGQIGEFRSQVSVAATVRHDRQTGRYILKLPDNRVETYDAEGRLVEIEDQAERVSLAYGADNQLTYVRDAQGRQLGFQYGPRSVSITLPGEVPVVLQRDSRGFLGSITIAGQQSRAFAYDEPGYLESLSSTRIGYLTGVFDELGVRFKSVYYNYSRQATRSELAGGVDRTDVTYVNALRRTVANALGSIRTHDLRYVAGIFRTESVSEPCPTCGGDSAAQYAYDNAGNIIRETDFKGVATAKAYVPSRKLERVRIEAEGRDSNPAGPRSDERKVETDWHAEWRIPVATRTYFCAAPNSTAQPCTTETSTRWALESIETRAVNSRGQVIASCAVDPSNAAAVGYTCGSAAHAPFGVRQTRYTYCEAADASASGSTCPIVGALKSVDGPRVDVADVTAYAYHAATDESGCAQATGPCHRRGDLHTVTNALGHVTTHARYDRAGRLTRSIDANGVVTELSYHPRGWLLSRTVKGATAADDATTTFAYTPTGLVDRITQADGSYLDYGYDDAHRLTSVTDALGNRIDYTLDPAGNRTAETTFDPQGAVKRQLSRVYNQLGQLREQRDAQLRAYVSEYDRNGNNTASTDPLSVRSEQTFDPLNRLQQSLQDVGGLNVSTGYRYDAQDRLTKVIDPKGLHTDYTYSGLGDLTQLSSPDTGITSYTVDEAGNRRTQTDARGVTVTMQYDALNRLIRQSNSQDNEVIAYHYDGVGAEKLCASSSAVGRLSQIEDRLGLLTYCYDHRGNVIAKHRTPSKFTPPHLAVTWSVHYSHTLADQLRTLQYPDGERVIYERDAAGRIRSVSTQAANGPVATPLITQIDYAPFGPPTRIVYASGSQWTRALDADYRIDRITAPGVDYDYSLDAVGNVISIAQGAASRSFEYDDLYRVTAMKQGASVLEGFGYDATGNRTSASVGGVAQSYAYPPDSHRLQSVAGEPRSYTAAGNASLIDGLTLEYSGFNRLITIPGQRGARQRNLYNGRGEREYRASYNVPRHFGYDESGRLLFETEGVPAVPSSTVRQRYLWLDDQPIAVKNSSDAYAGEWLHIHADHLGSPRAITRPAAANAVVWRWALEGSAFGQHPAQADVDGDGVSLEFNLRYPGQYFDSATGWHYNYFRDYEPATGRYVQSDPIGLGGGVSTFGYAYLDPLYWIDARGLSSTSFDREKNSNTAWLRSNNCYSYALGRDGELGGRFLGGGGTQPGDLSGHSFFRVNCDSIRQAAISDGAVEPIKPGDCGGECPSGYRKIRLVVTDFLFSRNDYHWFRQDSDGSWSSKPGAGAAIKHGNSCPGPYKDYTVDCGALCVR